MKIYTRARHLAMITMTIALCTFFNCSASSGKQAEEKRPQSAALGAGAAPTYAIAIHGGAGAIRRENMSAEMEQAIRGALNAALDAGETILKEGGGSLDAVTAAIALLEDSPLFNAGKGAVFTSDEKNELDASIMSGVDRAAGAAGGVATVKNPIKLARAVMERSEHVMLIGTGAEQFAAEQGLEIVDPSYFFTQSRWDGLRRVKAKEEKSSGFREYLDEDRKYGTVGCVALDQAGNIAAGTSTGGMTNKRYNRLGDAPVIGAGTFADNNYCGVSCTGHGEFFIRYVVAYDVAAMMAYKGVSLEAAANEIIHEKLKNAGGEGGLIAVDRQGNVVMPFNSAGMYRGYAKPGERLVAIYQE
jgi:beta-aspartyl-peptidase (threonine type)